MPDSYIEGWVPYESVLAEQSASSLTSHPLGDSMLYSFGTVGRPKGVKRLLSGGEITVGNRSSERLLGFGFHENTIYLSPAPLCHGAPFDYTLGAQSIGGTVAMMKRFNELRSLSLI